jgi:hypothetical protein
VLHNFWNILHYSHIFGYDFSLSLDDSNAIRLKDKKFCEDFLPLYFEADWFAEVVIAVVLVVEPAVAAEEVAVLAVEPGVVAEEVVALEVEPGVAARLVAVWGVEPGVVARLVAALQVEPGAAVLMVVA